MSDLSKKAQETRKLVLKTPEERASEKADEVFDWILSYFEKRREVVVSENSLTFDCFEDRISIGFVPKRDYIHSEYDYDEISLQPVTSKISLDFFLEKKKKRIESYEGFNCKPEYTDNPKKKKIIVTIE